jgi:NADH:ubiquinone oxidoreductase subunit 6 (subunit J)
LALLAVYILLPRPNPFPIASGIVAALAALVVGGFTIVPEAATASWVQAILFYSFSALALLGGLILVTQTKPARGAVAFALVVLSTCGLYLLQAAPFVMAGTIIIYAGAIVVTFLFVIMLSQQQGSSSADERSREPFLSCLAGGLVLCAILLVLRDHYDDGGFFRVSASAHRAAQAAVNEKPDFHELRDAIGRLQANGDAVAVKREFEALEPRLANPNGSKEEAVLALRTFARWVEGLRRHLGTITPESNVALSAFGGVPSNKNRGGQLPAANVVGLGRTLFSDHLLGVEMAGTLLLVATLGAIAIAHRHGARKHA